MNLKSFLAARLFGWRGPLVLELVDGLSKPGLTPVQVANLVNGIYGRWHR